MDRHSPHRFDNAQCYPPVINLPLYGTPDKFGAALELWQVLTSSKTLYRVWRMGYVQADNELAPRKPLYLFRDHFKGTELSQNSVLRLF